MSGAGTQNHESDRPGDAMDLEFQDINRFAQGLLSEVVVLAWFDDQPLIGRA